MILFAMVDASLQVQTVSTIGILSTLHSTMKVPPSWAGPAWAQVILQYGYIPQPYVPI